jgi:hypothetical protein
MLTGFQKYLVDKGFKRICTEHCGTQRMENYTSNFLSSYNPLLYEFTMGDKWCYWGLSEYQRPPVMFLGFDKITVIQNRENLRTKEDGYRVLFSAWKEDKFDEIYDVFMSENKYFLIDCRNEKNISILIKKSS